MRLDALCKNVVTQSRLEALKSLITKKKDAALYGLSGSSAAVAFAYLPLKRSQRAVIICDDADEAGYMYHDLTQILTDKHVLIFPSGYKRDIKYGQIDAPSQILRTEVLNKWESDAAIRLVVTYPEALAEKVAKREDVLRQTMRIATNEATTVQEITNNLREFGFVEVDYVYEPGQYALRGSILDIYSFANELPYRLDFGWGDGIDSIRTFNVETQLSEEKVSEIYILNNVDTRNEENAGSFLDYIEDNTILILHNRQLVTRRVEDIGKEKMSENSLIANEGDKDAMKNVVNAQQFSATFAKMQKITYSAGDTISSNEATLKFNFSPQGIYHKNFDLIGKAFYEHLADGYKLYILSDTPHQLERLHSIFEDRGEKIPFIDVDNTLHEGFVDHDSRICVFTDHQIFDRFHKYNLKSDRARSGKLALSLKELHMLEVGDYVVHIDHGVGKFCGLVRVPDSNGVMHEKIKVSFLNNDFVLMSIHALYKLSKYRSKEGAEPRLNKLGSGAWNRIKDKTKSKLKDIARDLIQLYAARKQEQGHAFLPDGTLQQQLEASFIYEDTPDQEKATQDVKRDMESTRPMDRLICGDVGFGKTEVAIRAAFKAANEGKQTAVLVPTTVLAYQHFNTFSQRLADFPIKVEYISRARRPKDIKRILEELANGQVDIIIGTHKLIGKSVKFKDLGLLIIDEEQKFGVSVKEKLKQMKVNVDTLTLSATPIPRTLQFSLMGARDLTAITTPPPNRYPILTTISTFNDDTLLEAINFELSRNGQIFFINNRIEQLYSINETIHRLVPDARVIIAHGQMPPENLEKAIIDFANHDYDILLSTTIVESGIDMPNVNTIIINNAQGFGLSELHQLRGRVGRSSRKAFCYLLVPPKKALTPIAMRRLQTIESFSDLGSGIQIALQDLDIRGAGNLLGAEQSGFIADLGYEAYQKILKEAVIELRTEEFSDTFEDRENGAQNAEFVADCTVDSDLIAVFPPSYVPQESERILLYQELDNMESERDITAFRSRLQDRFGAIPQEADELINIVRLRREARNLGIEKVVLKNKMMYLYFVNNPAYFQSPAFGRVLAYMQTHPKRMRFGTNPNRQSMVIMNVPSVSLAVEILNSITQLSAV